MVIKENTNIMIHNKFVQFFFILLTICVITSCEKRNPNLMTTDDSLVNNESSIDTSKIFYPKKATNRHSELIGEEDTLSISINNYDFTIYPDGILKWGSKESIRLSKDMYATEAYFQLIDNDLLLFCEMSDFETGTTDIFRINLQNKHIKWRVNLNGFNMGQPVIKGNYGYVTAIGCVGKLDLITGKYLYKKSDLYDSRTSAFNFFDTIFFKENKTYFISKRTDNIIDKVIFDEKTNKLFKEDEVSVTSNSSNLKNGKIPKDAVKGDFNGDGKLEYMWLILPKIVNKTGEEGMSECADGNCTAYIKFSDKSIPSIKIDDCIDGEPDNLGDLNKDGADEIGILPGWFQGCWRSYYVWKLKNSKWVYAVQPFTTHCNQWDEGIKPIEIDLSNEGYVLIRYSEHTGKEIITKTKSVLIN